MRRAAPVFLLLVGLSTALPAETTPVEEIVLDNGMRFLVVERPGRAMVAAGWAARVGSGDEAPGRTGLSHLLEHLMFKGTRTIGAVDPEREAALLRRRDELQRSLLAADGAARRSRLEREAEELDRKLRRLQRKGEHALVYTRAGAVGINAFTREDLTAYYLMIPVEKLEVWFWMESDRLAAPVFRDLWAEHRIIDEERRQRIDALPTGPAAGRFDAEFWGDGHPYARRVVGEPADLPRLGLDEARGHFEHHYSASNLTAVLVGEVDPKRVRELARRYFGRLSAAPATSTERRREPARAPGEVRFRDACACTPQVEIRYRTVPFGHPDGPALEALAGLLNGRTGRLHRRLVLEQGIAFSASSRHDALRRAGSFRVLLEARGEARLADLEAAWERELARLLADPVSDRELGKVKNRITTDGYRQVEEPLSQMLRLLVYDALGDWRQLYDAPVAAAALTAEDLRRVARTYFVPERRGVAYFERAAGP